MTEEQSRSAALEQLAEKYGLSSEDVLSNQIIENYTRFSMVLHRYLRKNGPSRTKGILNHLRVNEALREDGLETRFLTQSKLAKMTGVTAQSMGEMLTKMEEEGLIRRFQCEEDRRSIYVDLGERGRKVMEEDLPARAAFSKAALECLSFEEKTLFLEMLTRLNEQEDLA